MGDERDADDAGRLHRGDRVRTRQIETRDAGGADRAPVPGKATLTDWGESEFDYR